MGFSISSSHNSNAIEGNTFTYDETRLLLKEGITSNARSFREHEEIIGYKRAFDYLYSAVKNDILISEEFIKKLHEYVLRGDEDAVSIERYKTMSEICSMSNICLALLPKFLKK